jgi:large subunit ribosomal protein L35
MPPRLISGVAPLISPLFLRGDFRVGLSPQETEMPKMKTKQAAAKRFSQTASGKLKHGVAGKRHRLISHNAKYIRTNRGTEVVSAADTPRIKKKFLPYGAQ